MMFFLRKRKDWKKVTIPFAFGRYKTLEIVIRNITCLELNGKRKYLFKNFGYIFSYELLYKKLTDFSETKKILLNKKELKFDVSLINMNSIHIEIKADEESLKDEKIFNANVAEAIILAFKSINLSR